jgi:predicted dehydrogenase
MRGARVTAIADPDPRARDLAASTTGAAAFADARDAIAHPGVDGVVVCAPNAQHAELALAALDAGRHLYLEKPLATDVLDGRRVVGAAERAGTVAAVGLAYRFDPLYGRVRSALRSIGPLDEVSTTFVEPIAPERMPSWKKLRSSGGGALLDLGVHHLDLLRWLAGESIAEIDMAGLSSEHGDQDGAHLHAVLTGGASFEASFGYGPVRRCGWVFAGEEGWLAVDRRSRRLTLAYGEDRPRRRPRADALRAQLHHLPVVGRERIFARALRAWVGCARGGQWVPELATLRDGLRALEAVESIEAAAAVPVGA